MGSREQTLLGSRYALTALKNQRGRLAGEIDRYKRKLAWAETQIRNVDATLHLLEPLADPAPVPPERPQKRIKLFRQGELYRLVMDALRRAGGPIALREIVTAVIRAGGLSEEARPTLGPRVRGSLAYLQRTGKVTKSGKGRDALWASDRLPAN